MVTGKEIAEELDRLSQRQDIFSEAERALYRKQAQEIRDLEKSVMEGVTFGSPLIDNLTGQPFEHVTHRAGFHVQGEEPKIALNEKNIEAELARIFPEPDGCNTKSKEN
jgi:hypothetical protein